MKTIRGTYFYIEMAGAFYAGTRPVMEVRKVKKSRPLNKAEKEVPAYMRSSVSDPWRFNRDRTVSHRRKMKMKTAIRNEYAGKLGSSGYEEIEVATSKFVDDWTDDFKKAKQFRLKSKAIDKANSVQIVDSVRAQVKFYEGDQK